MLQHSKAGNLAAGPGSELWPKRSLEEQPRKLEMLKEHLTRAEAAQRAGDATATEITLKSNVIELIYKSFFFFLIL